MHTARTLTTTRTPRKIAPSSRCAIYARYSPKPEGAGNENTIDSQIHSCKEKHAKECGCGDPALYIDRMASGKNLDRADLDRLRDDIQNKLIGKVYVHCLDRLSRKQVDLYLLMEEVAKHGAKYEFVNGNYDDSPEGNAFLGMSAVFAEYERAKFAERSRRGRKQIARSGKPRSSPALGYRYKGHAEGSEGEYELIPAQVDTVRRIFAMAREGKGNTVIARALNEEKVPTAKAGQKIVVGGKEVEYSGLWHRNSVLQVLEKTAYYGEIVEFGSTIRVPAIMTKAYWEECHAAQAATAKQRVGHPPVDFLLAGKIWCGCSHRFTTQRRSRNVSSSYRCANRAVTIRTRPSSCTQKSILQEKAESIVWSAIWETLTQPALLEEMIRAYRDSMQAQPKAKKDDLTRRLEKARKQVAHVEGLLYDADLDPAVTRAKLAEAKKVLQALEAEARTANVFDMPSRASIVELSKQFALAGPNLHWFAHRREVIEQVVQHILYSGNKMEIHCKLAVRNSQNCHRGVDRDGSFVAEIPFVITRLVA